MADGNQFDTVEFRNMLESLKGSSREMQNVAFDQADNTVQQRQDAAQFQVCAAEHMAKAVAIRDKTKALSGSSIGDVGGLMRASPDGL